MNPFEPLFRRLRPVEPDAHFLESSKRRLLAQIELEAHELWFVKLVKHLPVVSPSLSFLQFSRVRLIERVVSTKQSLGFGLAFLKRVTASVLVLMIAVMTTLLYVERDTSVSASDITFLEVLSGEAMVKRADRLEWDSIATQTELSEGDLVRIGDLGSAVIHFFDDSQLRLDQNSAVLLERMVPSSMYPRQGVISVYLQEGRAWVQTLNVDDGETRFDLIAPHAIVSSQHASFDVSTNLLKPTLVRAFRRQISVTVRNPETGLALGSDVLGTMQQITLSDQSIRRGGAALSSFGPVDMIRGDDQGESWVVHNIAQDQNHLAMVRERELHALKASIGSVPGDFLYPLKRAKERLSFVLPFKGDALNNTIDIANQRLNEAIVLFESGDDEKAKLALLEYQNLVRQIADDSAFSKEALDDLSPSPSKLISSRVVRPHQKTLVAALPGDSSISLVKQVLDESEQLFVDDWQEKIQLRLDNGLENMTHIQDVVAAGDLETAKQLLLAHQMDSTSLLAEVESLQDEDVKKNLYAKILTVQQQEGRLLGDLAEHLVDQEDAVELSALVDNASRSLEVALERTVEVAAPLLPDVALRTPELSPTAKQVNYFVEKIQLYKTERGQHNQLSKLFIEYPETARDLTFMSTLADALDGTARVMVEDRMDAVRAEDARAVSRETERKIQRQMDLRKKREEGQAISPLN
ncbi:hypothetical protein IPJ72_00280 [Candidatus Peregrinibacteria bacterium]|nr:MAG: hypothetical protein IPJ72_00280 [Candidatus Peregrinibacteria bacterium]